MSTPSLIRWSLGLARMVRGQGADRPLGRSIRLVVVAIVVLRLLAPAVFGLVHGGDGERLRCQIGSVTDQEQPPTAEDLVVLACAVPETVPALLVVLVAGALGAASVVLKHRLSAGAAALALGVAGASLGAVGSYWTVLVGVRQVPLVRHLLVFDVLVVWAAVLAVAAVVVARRQAGGPARSAAVEMPPLAPPWLGEMVCHAAPGPATTVSSIVVGPSSVSFDEELLQGFLDGAAAANANDPHCWSWLYDEEGVPAPRSAPPDVVVPVSPPDVCGTDSDLPPEPDPAEPTDYVDGLLGTSDLDYLEVLRSRSHLAPPEPPSPRRPS